jgi:excinuclease ABC subunit A
MMSRDVRFGPPGWWAQQLVDCGNTGVTIERNLDIIKAADWIIDVGPEGGNGGGEVVAMDPPDAIIANGARSHTARFLREFLNGGSAQRRSETAR